MGAHLNQVPNGPSPAESRMFAVWDTFSALLRHQPAEAVKFSYAVAEVAEQYQELARPSKPGRKAMTREDT